MRGQTIGRVANKRRLRGYGSVFFVVALLLCATADALTVGPLPIEREVSRADIVIHARIESVASVATSGEVCGARVTARVLDWFKSSSDFSNASTLTFGRGSALGVGKSYVLFLSYVRDVETAYEQIPSERRSLVPRDKAFEILSCNGIIPGLIYDPWVAWEVVGDGVQIIGIMPSDWPPSIPIYRKHQGDGLNIVSRRGLFEYLHQSASN